MTKILLFGDVFGKPGRQALAKALPEFRDEHKPDLIIANIENMAHGKGVTLSTIKELEALGVDVFTSGNHVFDKYNEAVESFNAYPNFIRPANYQGEFPGKGWYRGTIGAQGYTVINLNGRVFFNSDKFGGIDNPFFTLDRMIADCAQSGDIIIVDFHADATSEKTAFGWYADGRVTAVVGTHSHVPTADQRILPKGTAYVTDIGMNGPLNSVIGVVPENSITTFLGNAPMKFEVAEAGLITVNAILLETDGSKALSIKRLYQEFEI